MLLVNWWKISTERINHCVHCCWDQCTLYCWDPCVLFTAGITVYSLPLRSLYALYCWDHCVCFTTGIIVCSLPLGSLCALYHWDHCVLFTTGIIVCALYHWDHCVITRPELAAPPGRCPWTGRALEQTRWDVQLNVHWTCHYISLHNLRACVHEQIERLIRHGEAYTWMRIEHCHHLSFQHIQAGASEQVEQLNRHGGTCS